MVACLLALGSGCGDEGSSRLDARGVLPSGPAPVTGSNVAGGSGRAGASDSGGSRSSAAMQAGGSAMSASSNQAVPAAAAGVSGSGGAPASLPPCGEASGAAVVTDIHGTLSVEDWLDNLGHQTARPGAAEMLQEYAKRGYFILYVSGAPRSIIPETVRWFKEKGFPTERAVLTMPQTASLVSSVNRMLKTGRLQQFEAEGFRVEYGYGDKDSDVQAYQAVDLATDHIFTIGDDAGLLGTIGLDAGKPTAQAGYGDHVTQFVTHLPSICVPPTKGADLRIVE